MMLWNHLVELFSWFLMIARVKCPVSPDVRGVFKLQNRRRYKHWLRKLSFRCADIWFLSLHNAHTDISDGSDLQDGLFESHLSTFSNCPIGVLARISKSLNKTMGRSPLFQEARTNRVILPYLCPFFPCHLNSSHQISFKQSIFDLYPYDFQRWLHICQLEFSNPTASAGDLCILLVDISRFRLKHATS